MRLRPRKPILQSLWQLESFWRKQCTSRFGLSSYNLPMDKKWKKSIFQLLPLDARYLLTVALYTFSTKLRIYSRQVSVQPPPPPPSPSENISLTDNKLPTVINLNLLCKRKKWNIFGDFYTQSVCKELREKRSLD